MITRLSTMIALVAGMAAAAPALAQNTLTEEQIMERFQAQSSGLGATRSLAAPEPVLHRGLVIAPAASGAATTAEAPATASDVEVVPVEYEAAKEGTEVQIQIKFDVDSSFVREDQKPELAKLCNVITAMEIPQFRIIGHTDASGSAEYNDTLSVLRAESVKRHLVNECGIATERLQAIGVGERYPANEANPRAQENRRVEFQVVS